MKAASGSSRGASRGIGYATAAALLRQGTRVALCAQNAERLEQAAADLGALGTVWAQPVDLRRSAEVERFMRAAGRRFGGIDVLVNNAGRAWAGNFADQPLERIDAVVDTNVKGLMYATRCALDAMLARGNGVIVNIASGAGLAGIAGIAVYSASKFAVVGFTQALSREVSGQGVRVYALCPGRVATDMQDEYSGRRIDLPPERVAEAAVQLAGPRPRSRSGSCIEL